MTVSYWQTIDQKIVTRSYLNVRKVCISAYDVETTKIDAGKDLPAYCSRIDSLLWRNLIDTSDRVQLTSLSSHSK